MILTRKRIFTTVFLSAVKNYIRPMLRHTYIRLEFGLGGNQPQLLFGFVLRREILVCKRLQLIGR
jgi:hypothetical protein